MPSKLCQGCSEPYPGFGPTCGKCRRAVKSSGACRPCEKCGQIVVGLSATCGGCGQEETRTLVGHIPKLQAAPRPEERPEATQGACPGGEGAPAECVKAQTGDELCAGLARTRKGNDHWCCESDFLVLCGLTRQDLEASVKKWWGADGLWLDMLATETARGLGAEVGLESCLGASWVQAADHWVGATYATATASVSSPPARAMLFRKAMSLVNSVLHSVRQSGLSGIRRFPVPKAVSVVCEACGVPFSQRLGRCPGCFPPEPPRAAAKEAVNAEPSPADWKAYPRAPIDNVNWAETAEVLFCHGGSGGVFLVRLPSGVVCAKSCSPGELFAQRLASALGVTTAQMRVLEPFGEEADALRQNVKDVAPSVGDNDWLPIRKILKAQFLSVLEFVDGFGMMGMSAHTYLKQGADGPAPWYDLGRLMAFDLLINNFDRLPLAWANEGNLGNVMLGSQLGTVVGIDQCVAPITHKDGLQRYIERVREALVEARDGEGKAFKAVQEAIYNNTAADLSAGALQALRRGCLDFAREVTALESSGELEGLLDRIGTEVEATFVFYEGCDDLVKASRSLTQQVVRAIGGVLG